VPDILLDTIDFIHGPFLTNRPKRHSAGFREWTATLSPTREALGIRHLTGGLERVLDLCELRFASHAPHLRPC
jgi:hypothetical protein